MLKIKDSAEKSIIYQHPVKWDVLFFNNLARIPNTSNPILCRAQTLEQGVSLLF